MFGLRLYLLWHIRAEHIQIWVDNKLYCHELLLLTPPSSEQYSTTREAGLDAWTCVWQLKTQSTWEEKVSWRSRVLIVRVWPPDVALPWTRMDWALRREVGIFILLVACAPNLYPNIQYKECSELDSWFQFEHLFHRLNYHTTRVTIFSFFSFLILNKLFLT